VREAANLLLAAAWVGKTRLCMWEVKRPPENMRTAEHCSVAVDQTWAQ